MILITGATGFIGNVLIRHISNQGHPIKLLIPPSKQTPDLPKGIPFEVAVTSLTDDKGLRAAMKDVDVIFHLASAETLGRRAQLTKVDINGTQNIVNAATQARINRFFYVSNLDADRASAYPLLKAKAIAEHAIKSSGIPYTIFRSSMVFGEQDHFTNGLAFLLKVSPYFVMVPSQGSSLLQPIWVEDLATILSWSLELPWTINQTIPVGGPEYLSFRQICEMISEKINVNRQYVDVSPIFLNILTELIEIMIPSFPTSVFWLDHLAADRITNLDTLPGKFNLIPAQMSQRLGYLEGKSFGKKLWRMIYKRKRTIIQWD
jgi:NADH dehydrogenase